MKTDLAYINQAADAALVRERESPRLPASITEAAAQAAHTTVAGFAIIDTSATDAALDKARGKSLAVMEAYKRDHTELAKSLESLGVKPLAIIPTRAWNEICVKSALYRLAPDKDREIKISTAFMGGFQAAADRVIFLVCTGVVLALGINAGIASAAYIGWPLWANILVGCAAGVVSAIVLAVLILGVGNGFLGDVISSKLVKPALRRFAARPWGEVLNTLLPQYKDMGQGDAGRYFKVVLPQPPADVVEVLIKAKTLKLKVAAVAEAISFEGGTDALLVAMYGDFAQQRATQRAWERSMRWDPIIYHEHESATAIIAQFGDFPVEQEVVDQVLDSEYLL